MLHTYRVDRLVSLSEAAIHSRSLCMRSRAANKSSWRINAGGKLFKKSTTCIWEIYRKATTQTRWWNAIYCALRPRLRKRRILDQGLATCRINWPMLTWSTSNLGIALCRAASAAVAMLSRATQRWRPSPLTSSRDLGWRGRRPSTPGHLRESGVRLTLDTNHIVKL